jgi:probable HAF family extracellular repeat protein
LRSLPAQAAYDFKPFQNSGATVTRVLGLNGLGKLVGMDDVIHGLHAFVGDADSHSSLDSFGILGTHTSFARGINNQGDIVGGFAGSDGKEHGFLIRQGKLKKFDAPFAGAVGTQLNAINDSGTIVGVWIDAGLSGHGFIYQDGKFARLDYPGARDTIPFGINSQGDIVGNWDTDHARTGHGFIFSGGRMTSFDAPSAVPNGTAANGINDSGQIVGAYLGHDGHFHAFLREASTFTTLDCPRALDTIAWGINSAGEIAGNCDDQTQHRGFVARKTLGASP